MSGGKHWKRRKTAAGWGTKCDKSMTILRRIDCYILSVALVINFCKCIQFWHISSLRLELFICCKIKVQETENWNRFLNWRIKNVPGVQKNFSWYRLIKRHILCKTGNERFNSVAAVSQQWDCNRVLHSMLYTCNHTKKYFLYCINYSIEYSLIALRNCMHRSLGVQLHCCETAIYAVVCS